MSGLRRRGRHLVRALSRAPGFAAVAVVTIALAVGANAAIFSVVDGVLLEPLPFPEADRLVAVTHDAPGLDLRDFQLSDASYLHFGEQNRVFEGLAIWLETAVNLTGEGNPERLPAALVSASLLDVLGVEPARGRGFRVAEERPGGDEVVLLSHGLWRRRYGADPGILGATIRVDGVERQVVGVMPPGFTFPDPEVELWLPVRIDPAVTRSGNFNYDAVARLRPGVALAAARADLDRVFATLAEAYPGELSQEFLDEAGFLTLVKPLKESMVGDVGPMLWVLLGSVGVILAIASANVANLFLVRAESRQRETAVRTALGAGRGELLGGHLVESLALALAGGALGLLFAATSLEVLRALGPNLPRLHEVEIDGTVLAFTAAVSLLAALFFGLVPALHVTGLDPMPALREGGRGATAGRRRHRARHALVAAQVALALVLLVSAGLLARSFAALRAVETGFDPAGVLTLRLNLPRTIYTDSAQAARFYDQLLERVEALPGVVAAGAVLNLPLGGSQSKQGTAVEDFPRTADALPFVFAFNYATPGSFKALGIPLVAGRAFTPADHQRRAGTALVSTSLAQRLWPGESALGKRLRPGSAENGDWYTIVGVVGPVRDTRLEEPVSEMVYYPIVGHEGDDWVSRSLTLAVRTRLDPLELVAPVRSAVGEVDPDLPIAEVRTLEAVVERASARARFTMVLLVLAAGLAVALGAVGLYGVIAYVVGQRTQEIGVRMALGAGRGRVSRMVVGQGLGVAAAGVAIGLAVAFAVTRLLASLLYEVGATDPLTFVAVPVALLAVAALASYLPARRAAAAEPVEALRCE